MKDTRNKKSTQLKNYEKALKELQKPKFIDKLELGNGEVYVGNLSDADKYQLLIRHINVLENAINLMAQFNSINAICLQEICKKQGIDIEKIINNKE